MLCSDGRGGWGLFVLVLEALSSVHLVAPSEPAVLGSRSQKEQLLRTVVAGKEQGARVVRAGLASGG